MKKNLLSFSFLSLLAFGASAQQWAWAKPVNNSTNLTPHNAMTPGSAGTFYNVLNGSSGTTIIRFDTQGNELWRKNINGTLYVTSTVNKGNHLYLTGSFQNTLLAGSFSATSAGDYDAFVMDMDTMGNVSWLKSYGGTGTDYGNGAAVDNGGRLHLTGSYQGTAMFGSQTLTCTCGSALYIAELTSAGNIVKLKASGCLPGNSFAKSTKIVVDSKKNIYISGEHSYFTLDTFQITGGGGPYGAHYVAKLDSNAVTQWAQIDNSYITEIPSMTLDSSENVLLNGYNYWTVGGSAFTMKYAAVTGQLLWNKASGDGYCSGDNSSSSDVATKGDHAYVFGQEAIRENCTPGTYKVLLVKLDAAGNEMIHDTIDASTNYGGFDMIRDSYGDLIVGFYAINPGGSVTLGANTVSGQGCFIAKLKDLPPVTTGIAEQSGARTASFYPNPTSGRVKADLGGKVNAAHLKVYDCLGNCVMEKAYNGVSSLEIDLQRQQKGVYFVELNLDQRSVFNKVIVE